MRKTQLAWEAPIPKGRQAGRKTTKCFLPGKCVQHFILPGVFAILLSFFLLRLTVSAGEVCFSCNTGGEKKIALTFDDGPHPVHTKEILDILEEYHIPATFFCIGSNAQQWPELVEAEIAAGHEIGNHTFDHPNLKNQKYENVRQEILDTEDVLQNLGKRPVLFRPPGGLYCDEVCRAAAETGYTVILWSVDPRDWAHTAVEDIVETVLTSTDAGDILLFHDYVSGDSPTPEAIRRIVPELLQRGYTFVTVSELLENA